MNLGQAVAVCLYEMVRDMKSLRRAEKTEIAASGEIERITGLLMDVLQASGYLVRSASTSEEKIRRLVRRLSLSVNDAEVLLGMLRQIGWKLRRLP